MVRKGEFLTLLGPSGSGKTTILNIIAGTIQPSSGQVWIGEREVTKLPSNKRHLGMVFQNYALMPHMTIFENVAFPLRVRRLSDSEISRKVNEVLEIVQLPHVAQRKPKELSGGQQQRIAIARCLVYNPDIILMDEPLGALDKKLREQMQLEIKRLHNTLGVTILYVTHDQEEALVMSDRICLMNAGRIEQLDTPHQLYFNPRSVFAADFLGESNILEANVDARSGMVHALDGAIKAEPREDTTTGPFKLMIRPENLTLLADDEDAPCLMQGRLEDAIFVGGVTNFRVQVADGIVLTAKRLTRPEDLGMTAGRSVRLGWRSTDVLAVRQPG
jgi:putative spermidine/putrescine transport system ATP-binding protein